MDDEIGGGLFQPCGFGERLGQVMRRDGKGTALRGEDRCVVEQGGHGASVKRCGHDEQDQVGAQGGADFPCERKAEIGVEGPLMEFVKDNSTDARQFGVGLDHAGKDAFGDDLNVGGFADGTFAAHAVADGLTDRLA